MSAKSSSSCYARATAVLAITIMTTLLASCSASEQSVTLSSPPSGKIISPSRKPSTAATPAAKANRSIIVLCYPSTIGASVEIATINADTGEVKSTRGFMYQSEQFNTRYGQVTWQPTDDSDIEGGNGDPCTSSAWDQTYSRIMGTVSITNGNSVPA